MQTISLKRFVETGQFGSIALGASKANVIDALGGDFDCADCGESEIIKYGWYEFFLCKDTGKLFAIQNDHLQADCENHAEMIVFGNEYASIDPWFLQVGRDQTFAAVVRHLEAAAISFQIEKKFGYETTVLTCASGVTFDFVDTQSTWVEKPELREGGEWIETAIARQEDWILNGFRLFDLSLCTK